MQAHRIELVFISFLFFLFSPFALADSIPSEPAGYVTDLTHTISLESLSNLKLIAESIEQKYRHPVYVLVAHSLEGRVLEEVTIEIAEKWKIGNKGVDDGVLIFFFLNDRKVRIEVGYGLEGTIPDVKAKQIIRDVIVPSMKKDDLVGAIANTYSVLDLLFSGDSNIDPLIQRIKTREDNEGFNQRYLVYIAVFLFGLVFFIYSKRRLTQKSNQKKVKDLQSRIDKALLLLEESNPFWLQTKQKFNAEVVESKRKELQEKGRGVIEEWKNNTLDDTKLIFWLSDIDKVHTRPRDIFPADWKTIEDRFLNIWNDLPWETWKTKFTSQSILETKQEWEAQTLEIQNSQNVSDMEKFINNLKHSVREPELYFYPEWSLIQVDADQWISDDKVWSLYRKQYEKRIVEMHRELVLKKIKEWKTSPPNSHKEKLSANRFWIANIARVKASPDIYFSEKMNPQSMYSTSNDEHINRSSDWSNSSDSSSNNSSSSSSSSGRGGNFGGGGSSGSW